MEVQCQQILPVLQERWGYICPDVAKEFAKYDADPDKWMKKFEGMNSVNKQVMTYMTYK